MSAFDEADPIGFARYSLQKRLPLLPAFIILVPILVLKPLSGLLGLFTVTFRSNVEGLNRATCILDGLGRGGREFVSAIKKVV